MATKEEALEKYSRKAQEVESYVKNHQDVFGPHQKLLYDLMDAENELKDAVAEEKATVSNTQFECLYNKNIQRIYNENKMHELLTPTQFASVVDDVERSPRIVIHKKF